MSEINIPNDFNVKIDSVVNKIQRMLKQQIENFNKTEEYVLEQIDTLNTQRKDVKQMKQTLNKVIEEAKTRRDHLKQINQVKEKEVDLLKSEYNTLDENYKLLISEYEDIEEKCLQVKSKLIMSPQDKLTLEIDQMKLDLYKDATNIVWDYSVPINSTVSGCVRNKQKNYLQTFAFKRDEMTQNDIEQRLWKEIEKGLDTNFDDVGIHFHNKVFNKI